MGLKATLKYISHLNVVNREIGKFITRAVDRSSKVMERNVKAQMHKGWGVQDGHLRRSIHSRMTSKTSGEVYNEATEGGREINYAVHVEYGTRHMAPRAMFRRGVAESEPRIKEIFKEEARKVHDKASGN